MVKPATDITQLDNVSGLIEYYIAKDVSKLMRLDEFLSLPHEYLQLVVSEIGKKLAKDNKTVADINNNLKGLPKK